MGVLEIESRHHFLLKVRQLARATPAKVFSRASRLSLRPPWKEGMEMRQTSSPRRALQGGGDGPPQSSALNSAPST